MTAAPLLEVRNLTVDFHTAGGTVHAVELDPVLAEYLRKTLGETYTDRFRLLEGDAVRHPRADIPATWKTFKVVANLPYAITTPWLEAILRDPLPTDMVLMMQKEAADRITAKPGSKAYGAISIFFGAAFARAAVHPVARSCFYPVPGVDSLLLQLRLKEKPVLFSRPARNLIRQLFTQRRKQIGSLLSRQESLQPWLEELDHYGCSRQTRPEAIPLDAWLRLCIFMQ